MTKRRPIDPEIARATGERIVACRKLAKVSQKRFCDIADLTPGHLSRIENGKRGAGTGKRVFRLRRSTVECLVAAFDKLGVVVTYEWIVEAKGLGPRRTEVFHRRFSAQPEATL